MIVVSSSAMGDTVLSLSMTVIVAQNQRSKFSLENLYSKKHSNAKLQNTEGKMETFVEGGEGEGEEGKEEEKEKGAEGENKSNKEGLAAAAAVINNKNITKMHPIYSYLNKRHQRCM